MKAPFTPSFTATDGGTTNPDELIRDCKIDAGGANRSCTGLTASDGPHTLFVRARDKAGNAGGDSVGFVADSTGPRVSVTSGPPNNAIVNSSTVTYAWTASDDSPPLSQTCKLDGGAAGPCSSPKTYSGLSEGSHTFTLRVLDGLGNATQGTRQVFVNAVRPSVAITSGPAEGQVIRSNAATFGFTASGGSVQCALDSETAYRACSSGNADALRGLSDGAHTFRVRVRDESDDTVVKSRAFAVDTSVPPPPPPPTPPTPIKEILKQILNPSLTSGYKAFKRYTVYKTLVVKGVPAGATVSVKCKGKKCPAKSFSKTGAGNVKLKKFLKKKLRAGTKLTIRITKPGSIGKQFVIKIRKGKTPKLTISQIA